MSEQEKPQKPAEKVFSLQDIAQLFVDWCNQPENFFQRKQMTMKSKVEGAKDKVVLGAGSINFVIDFPQFCEFYLNQGSEKIDLNLGDDPVEEKPIEEK